MGEILIDPKISLMKFNREVENLQKQKLVFRKRGGVIEATPFSIVRVTFIATGVLPPIVPLTVDIDFTNYNLWAPSVRFLNPIQFSPIYLPAVRKLADGKVQQLMIQGHPITKEPFICLPGVREYHNHPEHSGDSWDLHRYTGEGTLYFLLDNVWTYCIKTIKAYSINLQMQSQQIAVCREAEE